MRVYKVKRRKGPDVWKIDYVGLDGRRRRKTTTAANRVQAQRFANKKLEEITNAKLLGLTSTEQLSGITFEKFVTDEYLPSYKATKRATSYESHLSISRIVLRTFGKLRLRAITTRDVLRYRDNRLKAITRTGRAIRPATVNREISFVSGTLQEAVARGYVDRNVVREIKRLREDNRLDRWLREHEYERILEFCPSWIRPMVEIAAHTGMRVGEIMKMKWADIDRDNRQIRIPDTKNHKTHYAPMNITIEAVVDGLRPFVGADGHSPFVFVNPNTETPYFRTSPRHAFVVAAKAAGFDDIKFHTLRHTFASWMIQKGISKDIVQMILGHGSSHMTDRYAHLAPESINGVTDILSEKPAASDTRKAAK